ncbi:MAG: M56 family metallopeptidase [Streptosporangiaceae bacterium]
MTGALLLAGYAATAGWLAPRALSRAWLARAPRLAIALWLALATSWVAAAALAVLAATGSVPLSWAGSGPGMGPLAGRGGLAGTAAEAAGLLLAALLASRAAGCVAAGQARGWRERRQHAAFLAAASSPDSELGAAVLDDDAPAAYCLPGRRPQVVLSAGALAALGPGQLQAVMAHERAHLRGRHHLVVAWAFALGRAFPFVPLLARAGGQIAVLAEMAADDTAARRHDPAELAAAIARVQRLLTPGPQPGQRARAVRLAGGAAALILSAAVALLPLIVVACDVAPRT